MYSMSVFEIEWNRLVQLILHVHILTMMLISICIDTITENLLFTLCGVDGCMVGK